MSDLSDAHLRALYATADGDPGPTPTWLQTSVRGAGFRCSVPRGGKRAAGHVDPVRVGGSARRGSPVLGASPNDPVRSWLEPAHPTLDDMVGRAGLAPATRGTPYHAGPPSAAYPPKRGRPEPCGIAPARTARRHPWISRPARGARLPLLAASGGISPRVRPPLRIQPGADDRAVSPRQPPALAPPRPLSALSIGAFAGTGYPLRHGSACGPPPGISRSPPIVRPPHHPHPDHHVTAAQDAADSAVARR